MLRKAIVYLIWFLAVCGWGNSPALADWSPADGHKMHYPQLPDEAGWDVNATAPMVLADDWQCSGSGIINDIHFWGSWRDINGDGIGDVGTITSFVISIHEDIPANPPQIPYSRPGATLRDWEISAYTAVPIDPPTMEGWYDPSVMPNPPGLAIPNDHQEYFQYNIMNIPSLVQDPFEQVAGATYWLNISAVVAEPDLQWGWKSSIDHWNDDAVWATWGNLNWIDIWEPSSPIMNNFFIMIDPAGNFIDGGGTEAFPGGMNGWFDYPSGWLNIWFYDHPFDAQRKKVIHLEFDVFPMDPGLPAMLEFAVNWSTDQWLMEESPPTPPMEEPLLERHTFLSGEFPPGHYIYDFEVADYNPIWVSVDVRGFNFIIPGGFIAHDCVQSLDLSFVINGPGQGEPDINVIPPDLNYDQCLNTVQDYAAAFQICNGGTANLTVNSIACTLPFVGFPTPILFPIVLIPGQCVPIDLRIDTNGEAPGPHAGNFVITSNDPDSPVLNLPNISVLITEPDIHVTPDALQHTQLANTTVSYPNDFSIANNGDCDLTYSYGPVPAWLNLSGGGTLPPYSIFMATVTINTSGMSPGTYVHTVTINSNDPDTPVLLKPEITLEIPESDLYWKDFNGPDVDGGYMPDFDQNQDFTGDGVNDPAYCGPASVANSLWWFQGKYPQRMVVPPQYYMVDPPNPVGFIQELAMWMGTNMEGLGTSIIPMQAGINAYLNQYGLNDLLYEHTIERPTFEEIEWEIERCQDVTLLIGLWVVTQVYPPQQPGDPWFVDWLRIGGHYVTAHGVNSEEYLIGFSDPDADNFEDGITGGVLRGLNHFHGGVPFRDPAYNHTPHNDGESASHDVYDVITLQQPFLCSPAGLWELNHPYWRDVANAMRYEGQNMGMATLPMMPWTCPYFELPPPEPWTMTFAEIEYAVIISPTGEIPEPIEGDLNLHNTDGYRPAEGNPVGTSWDELWPQFGQNWNISSWFDNGDGILSVCDTLNLLDLTNTRYHVDWIGPTVTGLLPDQTLVYLEYIGSEYALMQPIYNPIGTFWHEKWPNYSQIYAIVGWIDNGSQQLDYCDMITIRDMATGATFDIHIEAIDTDITLSEIVAAFPYLAGDFNMAYEIVDPDNNLTGPWRLPGDVSFLVNYFNVSSGLQPCLMYNPNTPNMPGGPQDGFFFASADATGDCIVAPGDISRLVQYFAFNPAAVIRWCGWDKPDPTNYYPPQWLTNRGSPGPQPVPPLDELPAGWPNCQIPPATLEGKIVIPTERVK